MKKMRLLECLSITLAVTTGFTSKIHRQHSVNTYLFDFVGFSQSPNVLSNPHNYVYKGDDPDCEGDDDECAVELATATPPSDRSDLTEQPSNSVTFDVIDGMPTGGTEFVANYLRP